MTKHTTNVGLNNALSIMNQHKQYDAAMVN